jgi:hypothetical protein
MNGVYQCRMCQDSGRLAGPRDVAIACPHCARGAEYAQQLDRSETGARPRSIVGRPPRPVPQPRATGGALAPAEIAFALKSLLYVGVVAVVFFLYRADRGESDLQEAESNAPGADRAAEYSTWEPEQ